jgi:electron transfer flavoprotein beta subunit
MKAKKKPIDTRPLSGTGTDVNEPMVAIVGMRLPPQRTAGRIVEGDTAADQVAALVKALREEAKVI